MLTLPYPPSPLHLTPEHNNPTVAPSSYSTLSPATTPSQSDERETVAPIQSIVQRKKEKTSVTQTQPNVRLKAKT
jgi:hypothetical protein